VQNWMAEIENLASRVTPVGAEPLVHVLHDQVLEIHCTLPETRALLSEYLRYLEDAWPKDPTRRLRFTVSEMPPGHSAALEGGLEGGEARHAAGFELWRDGDTLAVRVPGLAAGISQLPTGRADLLIDPAGASDPFLVRDLLSVFLVEMIRGLGRFPLHASAGVLDGAGVVVLGGSGAGKTTLALGMSRAGLAIATDDWLLYRALGGEVEAFPLVRSVSLPIDQVPDPSAYQVLAHLSDGPLQKLVVARESLGPAPPRRFRPRLIVHARREDIETSELRPSTPEHLLAPALTQSALAACSASSTRDQIACLRQLLASCSCVELLSGRDIGRAPEVGGWLLRRHLEEVVGA
jgi:hypothetical protein